VGFQAAIVKVLPQGFHDTRRPCPGENMRFFNPLAVAFAVDTVISVNRIFLFRPSHQAGRIPGVVYNGVHHTGDL
jgi:hypothetical protein